MVRKGVILAVKRKFFPILPMPPFIQAFCGRRENAEIKTSNKKTSNRKTLKRLRKDFKIKRLQKLRLQIIIIYLDN